MNDEISQAFLELLPYPIPAFQNLLSLLSLNTIFTFVIDMLINSFSYKYSLSIQDNLISKLFSI